MYNFALVYTYLYKPKDAQTSPSRCIVSLVPPTPESGATLITPDVLLYLATKYLTKHCCGVSCHLAIGAEKNAACSKQEI